MISCLYIQKEKREKKSEYRSSDLKKVVTKDGNICRTDFIDMYGNITIAADVGYATSIISSEEGKTLEIYLDDKGERTNRIYSSYNGILREYDEDGNNIRITYLDKFDNPVIMSNGYAIEERDYDEQQRFVKARYYDTEHQPVRTAAYGCGRINEYNDENTLSRVTYIDENGKPVMTSLGYASYTRSNIPKEISGYDNTIKEFYYDENGKPIALSMGEYGIETVRNRDWLIVRITYLNSDGTPLVTNKGYTIVTRTYQADNHLATECYYDIEGKPYALSEGQYGYRVDGDRITYLDQNGRDQFNMRNLMYNKSWLIVPLVLITIIGLILIPRKCAIMMAIVYVFVILYFTIMFRESSGERVVLRLFHSYSAFFRSSEIRSEIIKNIWLFIPFGAILYRAHPHRSCLFIPIALSIIIENTQYFTRLGQCEMDDILSNCMGGIIGWEIQKIIMERSKWIKDWRLICKWKRGRKPAEEDGRV